MPTQLTLDVTPSVLDKAAKAMKRGKATERQIALNDLEAELEDVVSSRDPDGSPDLVGDFSPIVQSFWLDEANELHVVACVPATFIIPVSEMSDRLKRMLNLVKEPKE